MYMYSGALLLILFLISISEIIALMYTSYMIIMNYTYMYMYDSCPHGYQLPLSFVTSIPSLRQRQCDDGGVLIWDKDCPVDLDFVVCAANLRASVFDIKMKSKFTIKCEFWKYQ